MFAPCLLGLGDVTTNRLISNEQPSFVEQEHLERRQPLGVSDLVARAMQDIKEERLQQLGCVVPTVEVEGLELAERQRVFHVVEEKSVLSSARPAMEPILQLPDDLSEIAHRPLVRFENVHALDGAVKLALFFEIQLVSLALDQHAEQRIEELEIVARGLKRKWIDREIPRFVANV